MSNVYLEKFENIETSFNTCLKTIKSTSNNSPINSVLIKPNLVNDLPAGKGATTSLPVLDTIIDLLRKRGIKTIAVGESSIQDTETVFRNLNLFDRYKKKGVQLINLERIDKKKVSSPSGLSIKNFAFPEVIDTFDLIINVPKMKTHILTGVTLGMKNFFAFFSKAGKKFAHVTDIDSAIVDMYAYIKSIKPVLTIIDATVAMSGDRGPIHGETVNLGIVLMGCDTVAVDAAAVEIMGDRYTSIRHITLGIEHNLGKKPHIINNSGLEIDDIKKRFSVPIPSIPLKDKLVRVKNFIFKKQPILEFPGNCTRCRSCVEICPKECISLDDDWIKIDYKKCMSCLCCFEACKYKAMGYRVRFGTLYTILLFVKKLVTK
jgi:uncharacterized protein (DUF362 family)/Pyruvate/2-oxoacid:ferredoxin oxidoreductase delta subunit